MNKTYVESESHRLRTLVVCFLALVFFCVCFLLFYLMCYLVFGCVVDALIWISYHFDRYKWILFQVCSGSVLTLVEWDWRISMDTIAFSMLARITFHRTCQNSQFLIEFGIIGFPFHWNRCREQKNMVLKYILQMPKACFLLANGTPLISSFRYL